MTYSLMRWAHVLVMGYWLGSELVINALSHYVTRTTTLSGQERIRLWEFVLDVDQHVRNAMIMSVPLGFTLAAMLGLSPITGNWLALLWIASIAWFWFMWIVHLRRHLPSGRTLAAWDWRVRYVLIAAFVGSGAWSLATGQPFGARWLALKVLLFAGAIACGLAVRHYIRVAYASALPAIAADRAVAADNEAFRVAIVKATWVLVGLWTLLFIIGALGAFKPF
jgi:hypothetical protein